MGSIRQGLHKFSNKRKTNKNQSGTKNRKKDDDVGGGVDSVLELTSVSISLMFEVGWEGGRLARLDRLMAPPVSLSPSSLPPFTSALSLSVSAMLSVSS